jgi:hypothetical protein
MPNFFVRHVRRWSNAVAVGIAMILAVVSNHRHWPDWNFAVKCIVLFGIGFALRWAIVYVVERRQTTSQAS